MIRIAFGLEIRTIIRSPARIGLLALFCAAGLTAIVVGRAETEVWQEAIEAGQQRESETIAEARGYLSSGETGPADQPWIDLQKPLWVDRLAGTRLARLPSPLAGIAHASQEEGVVVAQVHRTADPLVEQGSRIRNPALVALGGLDLIMVLTLLLPALIIALGADIGGFERANGVLTLIRTQSGHDTKWLIARAAAVGCVGTAAGAVLALGAALVGGAGALSTVWFLALVTAYGAVWTTIVALVATRSQHPSHGAVALGTAWIVLCVIIPAIGRDRAAAAAADDFGVDLSLAARDRSYEIYDQGADTLTETVAARFPGPFAEEDGEARPPVSDRHLFDGQRVIEMEQRMGVRNERERQQSAIVSRMSALSPSVSFAHALECMAGRDAGSAAHFRGAVVAAVAERVEWILDASRRTPLSADDYEELIEALPADMNPKRVVPWWEFLILAAWGLAIALIARFSVRA